MPNSREEIAERMKKEIDELNSWIDRAEAKIGEMTEPQRKQLQEQLERAREGIESGKAKLLELKAGGEERLEEVRSEADRIWRTFKHSVSYFKSQL